MPMNPLHFWASFCVRARLQSCRQDTHKIQRFIDACTSNVLLEAQRERAVLDEGAQQLLVELQGTGASAGGVGEWFDIINSAVGHGVHFQPGPEIFDRIQFRGVGGKKDVDRWEAVSRYARVLLARCAFSRSQTRHQLASSSRSSAFRNAILRSESTSLPG